jgi:hypothetical protein
LLFRVRASRSYLSANAVFTRTRLSVTVLCVMTLAPKAASPAGAAVSSAGQNGKVGRFGRQYINARVIILAARPIG